MFSRPLAFSSIPKACGFEAAIHFPSILLGGSLIPIVFCGEAVPALRPAGILPAAENKGKMPSPHGDGFSPAKRILCVSRSPERKIRIPASGPVAKDEIASSLRCSQRQGTHFECHCERYGESRGNLKRHFVTFSTSPSAGMRNTVSATGTK